MNGFAKSAALTVLDWAILAVPRELAKNISAIQGHLVSHPCLAAQYIGYGALKYCKEDIDNMVEAYRKKDAI